MRLFSIRSSSRQAELSTCSYIPVNVTTTSPSLKSGKIYIIEIADTSIILRVAVADEDPIDPVGMQDAFTDTIRVARAKAEAWGPNSYLHAGDDPFISNTRLFTKCTIELESENKSRRSRQRLKYGRLVLVLRALRTFLFEGNKWHGCLVSVADHGLIIGQGSVTPPFRPPLRSKLVGLGSLNTTSSV